MVLFFAESEGFEPPIRRNAYTAFRVRLFRPLRQLSWVQRYCFFLTCANIFAKKCYFALILSKPEPNTPPTSAIETSASGSI